MPCRGTNVGRSIVANFKHKFIVLRGVVYSEAFASFGGHRTWVDELE